MIVGSPVRNRRARLTSAVLAAALTTGTLVGGLATAARADSAIAVTSTDLTSLTAFSSAPLTGLSVTDSVDETLQVTLATSIGTLDLQDGSATLALAYNNNWSGKSSVTFSGTVSDINNELATAQLVTGGAVGVAHVSLTATHVHADQNFFAPNQHFYQYVPHANLTWQQADAEAKTLTFEGQHGYLATIPDQQVDDFVTNDIYGDTDVWFGAWADSATNGASTASLTLGDGHVYGRVWRWAPGADESPLAGQVISACDNWSGGCDFYGPYNTYSAWAPGEPNNAGNEYAGVTNWFYPGKWNDLSPNSQGISGYLVEFGGKANDDPSVGTGFQDLVTAVSNVDVLPTVPTAPVLTARPTDGGIVLTWDPPVDGGAPITSYEVQSDAPGSVWAPLDTTTAPNQWNSYTVTGTVTGLTNGNSYTYRVRDSNSVGWSDPSDWVTSIAAAAPGAPTGLQAVAGDFSATLSWTAPTDDGGSPITGYVVSDMWGQTWSTTDTSLVADWLQDGVTYTFTVHAVNASGAGAESDPAYATPNPPVVRPTLPATANQPQIGTLPRQPGGWAYLVDDNGWWVDTVTVPDQGTYSLDETTGDVTFTPVLGFTGTPTPVQYADIDSSWWSVGYSTFAPYDVSAPDAPAPAVLHSDLPVTSNQPQQTTAPIPDNGSVTLLDAQGNAVTDITVNGQGEYVLDATTGVITFTPVFGFTGTPTPVAYRLVDAYNQHGDSTYAPSDVTPPDGPTAGVLHSDTPVTTNLPQHTTASIPSQGSVTLLDGQGNPASNVTVGNQGAYTLDPSTGVITFTPVLGFTGTPTPVDYRLIDVYGQHGDSTYAPSDVTPPAGPTASVLLSATPVVTNQPQHTTATIPASGHVSLLNGNGDEVAGVIVSGQGSYNLNPATGVITFTPLLGFTGTPTPVGYRLTDAYDQHSDATYAPSDVTAPAGPTAPALTPTDPADTNQPQSTTAVAPTGGSVTLVDGNGDPATTVTVPGQGTYVLDPDTGVITFTPDLGFTGTPQPVGYRVSDAYGHSDDSTFTPSDVTPPAGPVATNVTPSSPAQSNQPQHATLTKPTGGSVSLVDGNGDPATTVTVPGQGTYVLDPVTDVVTFTPAPGYAGTPTPASYVVTDAYGQHDTATFAPGLVTLSPSAPTGVTVVPGNGTATVHFGAPATDGGLPVTGYAVITSPGGARTPVAATGDVTITGLSNGVTYAFTVIAINADGESVASTPVSTTPRTVPGAPTICGRRLRQRLCHPDRRGAHRQRRLEHHRLLRHHLARWHEDAGQRRRHGHHHRPHQRDRVQLHRRRDQRRRRLGCLGSRIGDASRRRRCAEPAPAEGRPAVAHRHGGAARGDRRGRRHRLHRHAEPRWPDA